MVASELVEPFYSLAEAHEGAVLLVGAEGVEYANSAAVDLLERSKQDIVGAGVGDLLDSPPPGPEPGEQKEFIARIRVPRGVGALATGQLRGLPGGRCLLVMRRQGSLSDVGAMTAGLLHNLAGPLSVIRSTAEMLGNYLEQARLKSLDFANLMESWPESVIDGRQIIMERVDGITEAARDLLVKLRGEASQCNEALNLNEILRTEVDLLANDLAFKHKVITNLELAPQLPAVIGLYSDFSQSFRNILRNAVTAMAASPTRVLDARTAYVPEADIIEVTVSDTGSGIDQKIIDRIFDPFFTTGPVGTSTGLGLHSVRQLLLPYGVEFDVQSEPGHTCFTLNIPRKREERS